MKRLLWLLIMVMPLIALGQSVGQLRYDTLKVLKSGGQTVMKVQGAIQTEVQGTANTTSFSAVSIGRSFILGTIAGDETVTFPTLESGRIGTWMLVENKNGSAFVWNVAGPVQEAGTAVPITSLPIGLHYFWWNGTDWIRLSTNGGSSPTVDTLTFTSPLHQLDKNVYLDFSEFPIDTAGVVIHNDSLFNILYSYTGVRDSNFIVKLTTGGGGGGGNLYNMDSTLSSNRTVQMAGRSLLFQNLAGNGPHVFASGVGFEIQTNGSDAVLQGWNDRSNGNSAVETFTIKRTSSVTSANGIGQIWSFKGADAGSTQWDSHRLKSVFADVSPGSVKTTFSIDGIYNNTQNDWLTLKNDGALQLNRYGTGTHTGTAAYALSVDASGNIIETTAGGGSSTLAGLTDVTLTSLADEDYLKYDASLSKWKNAVPQEVYPIRIGDSIHLANGTDTTYGVYAPTSGGGGFANGGNSFGAAAILGTNDANTLSFETGGTTRATINNSYVFTLGAVGSAFYLARPSVSGTDVANSSPIYIEGGTATGTATPGDVIVRTATVIGSTSSSPGTQTDRLTIKGNTGEVIANSKLLVAQTSSLSSSYSAELTGTMLASTGFRTGTNSSADFLYTYGASLPTDGLAGIHKTSSNGGVLLRQSNVATAVANTWEFRSATAATNKKTYTVAGENAVVAITHGYTTPNASSRNGTFLSITPEIDIQQIAGLDYTGTVRGIWYNPTITNFTSLPKNHRGIYIQKGQSYFADTTIVGSGTSLGYATLQVTNNISTKSNVTVNTANTTPTTIATIPLATSGEEMEIDISVRAESGADLAIYRKLMRFKNASGTVSQLGSTVSIGTDFEDAALSAADVTVTVSGTNILVQGTGISGSVDWRANYILRVF